jgi:Adenylate kinase
VTMKLCSASARQGFQLGGELRLLTIAAPGGGKGTRGERLAAKFSVQHVSAGEVMRAGPCRHSGRP